MNNLIYLFKMRMLIVAFIVLCLAVIDAANITVTSPGNKSKCPVPYINLEGMCYHFSNHNMTFLDAWNECRLLNGLLASLDAEPKQHIVSRYINTHFSDRDRFWISGSDASHEGKWFWTGTGLPVTYENWCEDQPDDWLDHDQDCAVIDSVPTRCWDDIGCDSARLKFICEPVPCSSVNAHIEVQCSFDNLYPVSANLHHHQAADHGIMCPAHYIDIHGHCLHFSVKSTSFHQAWADCRTMKGDLLTIDDGAKMKKVSDYLTKLNSLEVWWIGGSDEEHKDQWVWQSTGQSFDYTNWCVGEPNNSGNESCLTMWQKSDHCWNDRNCAFSHKYICERP